MTLAAETMSSILHPTSVGTAAGSNHKSSKLGFSIDSIVGAKSSSSSSGSPPPTHPGHLHHPNPATLSLLNEAASSRLRDSLTISPTDLSLRNGLTTAAPNSAAVAAASIASAQEALRHYHNSLLNRRNSSPPPSTSPLLPHHNKSDITEARSRSPSRSPPSDDKRGSSASPVSPQPSSGGGGPLGLGGHRGLHSPNSSSPTTSPSLVRPIPTSLGGSTAAGLPLTAQSYLDHLATFKALYDNVGSQGPPTSGAPVTSMPSVVGPHTGSPLPPPPFPPGLGGPLGHLGLRPPGPFGGAPGLPPFLGGAPGGPGAIPPQIPREYPLYPWFISRRFPGGK